MKFLLDLLPSDGALCEASVRQKDSLDLIVASWMVRFAAPRLLGTDPDLALYGRYVVSERLEKEGFEFQFSVLREAFDELMGRGGS